MVTKLDVLDGIDPIRICTGYSCGDLRFDHVPASLGKLTLCKPIYEDFPGWKGTTKGVRDWEALPDGAQAYVRRLGELTGVPIAIVSTGPDRDDRVELLDPWN